jgi:hypothetical protein
VLAGFRALGQTPPADAAASGAEVDRGYRCHDAYRARDRARHRLHEGLQLCLAFETELAHGVVPGWSLVGRVHHRSGSFGILAEKDSGSNFIGMGLRRDF